MRGYSHAALEAKKVSKAYAHGERRVAAVSNASFSICRGEFVAVTGPSGSGKTTLLHMLGCITRPDSGEIFIDGEAVAHASEEARARLRRRKIGYIFQDFKLLPVLTARENICLPQRLDGSAPDMEEFRALTDMLGIRQRLDHYPHQLSGGERQRIAIARALLHRPVIILADEPTGNLDARNAQQIMDIFLHLHHAGSTLLMVTHNDRLAAQCSRTIRISDGSVYECM